MSPLLLPISVYCFPCLIILAARATVALNGSYKEIGWSRLYLLCHNTPTSPDHWFPFPLLFFDVTNLTVRISKAVFGLLVVS